MSHGFAHSAIVARLQARIARRLRRKDAIRGRDAGATATGRPARWQNLGLWQAGDGYDQACQRLALRLGEALLKKGDAVLCCGCGPGDELCLFKSAFGLRHITGIDRHARPDDATIPDDHVRRIGLPADRITDRFRPGSFNKIVALDCLYHFDDKTRFLADCAALLPPGGMVGVTDLLRRGPALPWWLRRLLGLANVVHRDVWTEDEYRGAIEAAGLSLVRLDRVGDAVLGGPVLRRWTSRSALRYLDYGVLVAQKPSARGPRVQAPRRPLVAVIGSGLSGLTAAQALAVDHDVTIFEANDKTGLASRAITIDGQTIDVPLRVIGPGYYNDLERLAQAHGVAVRPVRERLDTSSFGDASPLGEKVFRASRPPNLATLLQMAPRRRDFRRLARALAEPPGDADRDHNLRNESWGAWMERNGYDTAPYAAAAARKAPYRPDRSLAMWLLMANLSWVLSCSFQQILAFPAAYILEFCRQFAFSFEGTRRPKAMKRIFPSIGALETALLYGVEIRHNQPVSQLGADRVIDGIAYDRVIVATEASVVGKVLRDADPLFRQLEGQFQESTIVLHSDPSLMPARRRDWGVTNLAHHVGHDMAMITGWMNRYFPDKHFQRDLFQTWNPHRPPRDPLAEWWFRRFVHTSDSLRMTDTIAAIQGRDGIYFAGAYTQPGMGLLEQAARSGERAAALVRADLAGAATAAADPETAKAARRPAPNLD